MSYRYLKLEQDGIEMYLFKMNIDELLRESQVLRYDASSGENYQRPPIPAHYRKIANYLLHNDNPIMPTAILAAIDKNQILDENNEISFNKKIRIVDGQHRILGMKCLNDGYTKNSNKRYEELKCKFDFPVVLLALENNDSFVEVDAFININSKGKSVKTDLAEALKSQKFFKSRKQLEKIPVDEDFKNAIAMEISTDINSSNQFWKGLIIQPDELGKRNVQPISVLAFMRAIRPVLDKIIGEKKELSVEERLDIEERVENVISSAWDYVIDKWPSCFKNGKREFDQTYNICKGIGVVALFSILADSLGKDDSLQVFHDTIANSKVNDSDWLVGGNFTGFASQQGFAKVKEYILNSITKEQLLNFLE